MTARISEDYLLGSSDDELRRLAEQHSIWSPETSRLLDAARLAPGCHVADLGSGPGLLAADICERISPDGSIFCVDVSDAMLKFARERLRPYRRVAQAFKTSSIDTLALTRESIDVATCRWLLCYVPDVAHSVSRIAEVLRTGGRFAVLDYTSYHDIGLAPESAIFDKLYDAVYDSFADSGGSLDVGSHLEKAIDDVPLEISFREEIRRTAAPGSRYWGWFTSFQHTYFPHLVEDGYVCQGDIDEFRRMWDSLDREAVLTLPPMVAMVCTKKAR